MISTVYTLVFRVHSDRRDDVTLMLNLCYTVIRDGNECDMLRNINQWIM